MVVRKEQPSRWIVVCASTSHMLRLDDLLTEANIHHLLVPIPASIGDMCSVGIEIRAEKKFEVQDLIDKFRLKVNGLFPLEKQVVPGLLELLQDKQLSVIFRGIVFKIQEDISLSLEDINYLLTTKGLEERILFNVADRVRKHIVGEVVDVRAAIEFSNYCTSNCKYCGIRSANKQLARYRMDTKEIVNIARQIKTTGIKTVILQSGEDTYYTRECISEIIKEIKRETSLRITLSIGERESTEYKEWKRLGANNYLLKFETTSPEIYERLHPGENLEQRIVHLQQIKAAGYLLGTGNIVGLPGQTTKDLARDILFMKSAGTGMAGIGPFVPTTNTPLEGTPQGNIDLTLKTMAVTRLVLKNVFIPSTTALATLEPEAQMRGLQCGANSIMIINTPEKYRANYTIYQNKMNVDLSWTKELIKRAGRKLPSYLSAERS